MLETRQWHRNLVFHDKSHTIARYKMMIHSRLHQLHHPDAEVAPRSVSHADLSRLLAGSLLLHECD